MDSNIYNIVALLLFLIGTIPSNLSCPILSCRIMLCSIAFGRSALSTLTWNEI